MEIVGLEGRCNNINIKRQEVMFRFGFQTAQQVGLSRSGVSV